MQNECLFSRAIYAGIFFRNNQSIDFEMLYTMQIYFQCAYMRDRVGTISTLFTRVNLYVFYIIQHIEKKKKKKVV